MPVRPAGSNQVAPVTSILCCNVKWRSCVRKKAAGHFAPLTSGTHPSSPTYLDALPSSRSPSLHGWARVGDQRIERQERRRA